MFAYSSDISIELRTLYEEVFLCHSNFALGLLTEIVRRTRQIGMERAVLNLVRTRKSVIREILHDSALHIEGSSSGAELPLLWIDCSEIGDDQHVADIFRRNGVVVLPGHHFYWQQHASMKNWIRLSLLRPAAVFADGVNAISQILEQLPNNKLNDVLNIPNWMRWAPYVGERLQFTTE